MPGPRIRQASRLTRTTSSRDHTMRNKIKSWLNKTRQANSYSVSSKIFQEPWNQSYSSSASEMDILQCFRLLLGRNPHREEWAGHAARAGERLETVVAAYLSSLEFERRGLLSHKNSMELSIVSAQGFRIYVSRSDTDVGSHVATDNYEPDVTAVFGRVLQPGMGVIDIGANIGYFSMLSARLVGPQGHVLAVEPNPRNARMLEASRRLNDYAHVAIAQVAAGRTTGMLALHVGQSNGTTSTPSDDLDTLLGAQTVASLRIDDIAGADRSVGLIKLDVEGAEYNAIL
ncbi:MAG: FkbM family methyltransferase, partial [Hyphomicrobiales bacterium]